MTKVLFYHWDWAEQPQTEPIQRALDIVFDGSHAPRIVNEVPTANWDQCTIAIMSASLDPKKIGELFEKYLHDEMMWMWWDEESSPTPLEA